MSEFDRDLNPLLRRISNSRDGVKYFYDICELNDIDPLEGPDALASEIRLNGGNTLVNIFRGWEGVSYKEIVEDVADKLDIRISDRSSVEKMEEEILEVIIKEYWDKLSEEEKEKIIEQINEQVRKIDPNIKGDMIRNALRGGGIVATIALRGVIGPLVKSLLAKAAGVAVGARLAGFLVPGLNVMLAAWTAIDIAGPAYRKTVPTVVAIALSRIDDADD